MGKQKLELQINIPTTIRLLQTDPATGENMRSESWAPASPATPAIPS